MPKLYIVATPIGNLEDITFRALKVLREVDLILCEDTRQTKKLLDRYDIAKPTLSYHQHSKLSRVGEICRLLRQGKNLALVSDAGTPGISDPGGKLIQFAISQIPNLQIMPIPGSCAAIAALSISGFPADKFIFLGFPPHKKGRQKFWKKVAEAEGTVVFYESPYRIIKSLDELQKNLETSKLKNLETNIVVCRELTKMFETVYRGTISDVIEKVQKDKIKGEFVIVLNSQSSNRN